MKHVIIGTAGHIDHGKTTFIKALTGKNTDRLKEEQKRGISIELGFTYFDLPSGQRAGIIDVPGHERFIKNMLAGVIGIDVIILVVAADEGMMPQTEEHLAILDLLGIKKGFLLITKTDLVEEEWVDLVEEEIREEVKGTFLEDSPIVRVSSTTGEGIKGAIDIIDKLTKDIEEIDTEDIPRLPVDRVFTISGFGTIVTGSLLSGKFALGEEVQIFPGDKIGRIRSIQVHDADTKEAYAGQRVAINLAGLSKEDIDRGSIVAPKNSMKETMMLDVKVKLLKSLDRNILNRTRLKVYLGTREVLCRLVLLDRDELRPGEEAYAQLRLEESVVAKRGDTFILRFYSPMFTIGGGEILDISPSKKKRFDEESLLEMEIKEYGDSKDVLEKIIEDKSPEFPSITDLALLTSMLEEDVIKDLDLLVEEKKVMVFTLTKDIYPIHSNYFNHIEEEIISELNKYHNKYPLRPGIGKEEIRSKYLRRAKPRVGESLLNLLIENGYIEQIEENIKLKDFNVTYDQNQTKIKDGIIKILKDNQYLPPKKSEMHETIGVKKEEYEEVLNSLITSGEIIRLGEDVIFLKESYKSSLDMLKEYIIEKGSISIAEYRDLLNTNRKNALTLLEHFDQLKITKRDGESRILNN